MFQSQEKYQLVIFNKMVFCLNFNRLQIDSEIGRKKKIGKKFQSPEGNIPYKSSFCCPVLRESFAPWLNDQDQMTCRIYVAVAVSCSK